MERDDLLLPLLDGLFEEPLWRTFLDRLRERTGAGYVSLIFRAPPPARPSRVHLFAGEAAPPPIERRYREGLHLRDPLPYHQLDEGRVYRLDDFLDRRNPQHQAYWRDMLVPSRMHDARVMRIVEPRGLNVWLTMAWPDEGAAVETGFVEGLAPYLRAALRAYAAIERQRYAAELSGDAIRRLNYGWITLDAGGRVIEADAQGARILDRSGILRRDASGLLSARPAALDGEIRAAIRALAGGEGGREGERGDCRPRAIVLSREPWLDMLLMRAGGRPIAAGPTPVLIAYVHGDGWSSADRCEQLAELFGLSPSEARLALALSRGTTIAEAAAELGLTVETARAYSKRIYAKTGARGQPDLVRFVHRSVLAIA